DALVVVAHSDFDDESLDLEIGFSLHDDRAKPTPPPRPAEPRAPALPAVDTLATIVRNGPNYQSHLAFGALGLWMEANRVEITGPSREVFLKMPFEAPDPDDTVVEVQFPVRRTL